MSDPDGFDPDEVAMAEALDRQIDTLQTGSVSDVPSDLLRIHASMRIDPPMGLAARIEDEYEDVLVRRWRPFRYVAAAMAYLLISQGLGNVFIGDWVADGIGESFSAHANRESSLALIAAGIAVGSGALYRRFTTVSVASGVPLGIGLGIGGIAEVGVFAPGAALHLTQGVIAIVLAVVFWRYRRDTSDDGDEERAWT